jgi:hypothetical protein
MFGNFILKKLIESKLKDVPAEQRDKILLILEKKPELFQAIALEAKQKMDQGKNQEAAMMEVIKNHEAELRDVMK